MIRCAAPSRADRFCKVMVPFPHLKKEVSDGVEILNGLLTNDPLFCLQVVILSTI